MKTIDQVSSGNHFLNQTLILSGSNEFEQINVAMITVSKLFLKLYLDFFAGDDRSKSGSHGHLQLMQSFVILFQGFTVVDLSCHLFVI